MDLITLLKNSKIYNKNHPKFLEKILLCPQGFDIRKFNSDNYYLYKYLPKNKHLKEKEKEIFKQLSKEEIKKFRYEKYLSCKKEQALLLDVRPDDYSPSKYRLITDFKKEVDFIWLKKAQRKIHKYICSCITFENIPYLHSTIRNVSYASNSKVHVGEKNVLMIDLKDFFTKINKDKVKKTFMHFFDLHNNIAEIYASILTSPNDEPPFHNDYVLGQGLPSSPIIAYLCNADLFDYLNKYCCENNIKMTVYVDDVTFSSNEKIKQETIDKIIGTFIANGLKVNRNKVHLSDFNKKAKITGCYVSNQGIKVKNSKHEEIKVLYEEIKRKLQLLESIDDYFEIMNLFFKFYGNYMHLQQVEFAKKSNKYIIPIQFQKYEKISLILKKYFLFGKHKKNKNIEYRRANVLKKDMNDFNLLFQKIRTNKNSILLLLQQQNF